MAAERKKKSKLKSYGMLFLDKTNLIVTSITACVVLYTRSAGVAYFSAGAVACSISVKAIKRFIRQERPMSEYTNRQGKKKTYGMPSTHSATITFFAVYISLACTLLPIHPSIPLSPSTRLLPTLVCIPWAAMIVQSRIWLGHHTYPQVAVGSAYGAVFACLWFKLWTNGINGYGNFVEDQFKSYFNS